MCFQLIPDQRFKAVRLLITLALCAAWVSFAAEPTELSSLGTANSEQNNYNNAINRAKESFQEGRFEDAIADCNIIIQSTNYLPALKLRGEAYFGSGDNDKAIADLSRVIRLSPDRMVYFSRGSAYMEKMITPMLWLISTKLSGLNQRTINRFLHEAIYSQPWASWIKL